MTRTIVNLILGMFSEKMLLGIIRDILSQLQELTDKSRTEVDDFIVDALYNAVNRRYLELNAGEMRQGG